MASKTMYFGTKERMKWVQCPAVNADLSTAKWSAEGVFLSGGAYVKSSATEHKRYKFSWNMATEKDIYAILDYSYGLYGSDLIYFIEPFAARTNVLPLFWAAPRLQAVDAPSLTREARPTLLDTAPNTNGYPTKSAVYTFASGSTFDSLWVPVPDGYTFHFGVHGSASGTATITVTPDGGSAVNVTPLSTTVTTLTNTTVDGPTGVTISGAGVGGLVVAGMIAQVLPTGTASPSGAFVSGRGHSGCRFGQKSVMGYSSPQAIDLVAASADLIETGAWEN